KLDVALARLLDRQGATSRCLAIADFEDAMDLGLGLREVEDLAAVCIHHVVGDARELLLPIFLTADIDPDDPPRGANSLAVAEMAPGGESAQMDPGAGASPRSWGQKFLVYDGPRHGLRPSPPIWTTGGKYTAAAWERLRQTATVS